MVTGVDWLTVKAVTENVCDIAPCGTVTEAGTPAAALELESATTAPPLGAAKVSVTVPTPACVLAIVEGLTDTLLSAGGTGTTVNANVLLTPEKEAVSVTGVDALTVVVVIGKVCVVAPCSTVSNACAATPAFRDQRPECFRFARSHPIPPSWPGK